MMVFRSFVVSSALILLTCTTIDAFGVSSLRRHQRHPPHNTAAVAGGGLPPPHHQLESSSSRCQIQCPRRYQSSSVALRARQQEKDNDDDDNNKTKINPYADPNYPDLEFVDYSDPEYSINQSDEYFSTNSPPPSNQNADDNDNDKDDDNEQVLLEEMREEQRRGNDEYQFRTYHRDFCHTYRGEWTIYTTNLLSDPTCTIPTLQESSTKATVVSRGEKIIRTDSTSSYDIDKEFIRHFQEFQRPTLMNDAGIEAFFDETSSSSSSSEHELLLLPYWPETLQARDFRGEAGIMVCGRYDSSLFALLFVAMAKKLSAREMAIINFSLTPYGPYVIERTLFAPRYRSIPINKK
jgi:hypothetical protein